MRIGSFRGGEPGNEATMCIHGGDLVPGNEATMAEI